MLWVHEISGYVWYMRLVQSYTIAIKWLHVVMANMLLYIYLLFRCKTNRPDQMYHRSTYTQSHTAHGVMTSLLLVRLCLCMAGIQYWKN